MHKKKESKRILQLFGLELLFYVYTCKRKDCHIKYNQNTQDSSYSKNSLFTLNNSPALASLMLVLQSLNRHEFLPYLYAYF